jgi:hypothetical protein
MSLLFRIAYGVLYVPQAQLILWNGNSRTLPGESTQIPYTKQVLSQKCCVPICGMDTLVS